MRYGVWADGGDSFLSIEEAAGGGGATCAKYQKLVVIHTHGTNVTLDLRWRLASGSGQLREWSEAQRQVEAASGKVLQSHNESHAFRRYSPTPDAAAFGPPAGVACE